MRDVNNPMIRELNSQQTTPGPKLERDHDNDKADHHKMLDKTYLLDGNLTRSTDLRECTSSKHQRQKIGNNFGSVTSPFRRSVTRGGIRDPI